MERAGLAELMIAPLAWLERSRGWRRRGLAFLYLLIALTVGVLGWRELSLWRLPNAPEPFDLAKYGRVEVPDSDNAMVAFRSMIGRFGELGTQGYQPTTLKAWEESDWSAAEPEVRRWATDHASALTGWLPATDRGDSLLVQPKDYRMGTLLGSAQSMRRYVRLALLEGSRLEQSGDLAGAWRMYRSTLRASRQVGRHGGLIQRIIGNAFLKQARPRIQAWTEDPKVTPELLRKAIADVEACRAMSPPTSEMFQAEYFSTRDTLNSPDLWGDMSDWGPYSRMDWSNHIPGIQWLRRFLYREPERSNRVLRLIIAGCLAQCDRPPSHRPRLLFPSSMIYAHDAQTPSAVRSITPEVLEAWYKASVLDAISPFNSTLLAYLDAEPGMFDNFRLRMAERAYELEHGKLPKTYGDLLGTYLKTLPDGLEPDVPANPGAK